MWPKAYEWRIAGRYLRARKEDGFVSLIAILSLCGIGIGVFALIVVMSVMNGFREELLGRIIGVNGHLLVQSTSGGLPDYDALAERAVRVPGVTRATPLVENQVIALSGNRAFGALLRGVSPEDMRTQPLVGRALKSGSWEDFEGRDAVVLGDRLAQRLGLFIGDDVTLVAPQGTSTPFGTAPRMRAYRVVGTFNVGMFEYDSTFIYMPLAEAQIYGRHGDTVTSIEVFLKDPQRAGESRVALRDELGEVSPVRVIDWQQLNSSYFDALKIERRMMAIILTLITVVAAFNVVSSLIMLVKDKRKGIAIMRTIGLTRASVMRIFVICGASVGVAGTLIGFVLGLLLANYIKPVQAFLEGLLGIQLFNAEVYYLAAVPAKIDPGQVATTVLVALILSFLATLYPSWRAARMDPIEALRNV